MPRWRARSARYARGTVPRACLERSWPATTEIVFLAAERADSPEWVLAGSPTAAHHLAEIADVEPCTAREWRCTEPEDLAAYPHKRRSLEWRTEADGMITFTLRLPPQIAAVLIALLTAPVMRSKPRPDASARWPSLAKQHADAFVGLLHDGSGEVVTEVVLHVRGDGCSADDGTPIPTGHASTAGAPICSSTTTCRPMRRAARPSSMSSSSGVRRAMGDGAGGEMPEGHGIRRMSPCSGTWLDPGIGHGVEVGPQSVATDRRSETEQTGDRFGGDESLAPERA